MVHQVVRNVHVDVGVNINSNRDKSGSVFDE